MPSKATMTDCAFLRSKKTFSSNKGSFCFWYCFDAEIEPLLDEVRPLSQPTLALLLDSKTGVADAGLVRLATQLRRIPGRVRVRGGEEDLGTEGLEQGLHTFIGQSFF